MPRFYGAAAALTPPGRRGAIIAGTVPEAKPMKTQRMWTALAGAVLGSALGGCATMGGEPRIPEDAVENTRTEANGDTITEYRVGTELRMVHVVPARGPAYYLYDRDGDGRIDRDDRAPMTYYKLFGW
jgi:hypothetical protein